MKARQAGVAMEEQMVAYFTKFSFIVPVTTEQGAWFTQVHELARELIAHAEDGERREGIEAPLEVMAAALEFAEERDGLPGIQVTHDTGAGSVWVCAEECGDVEYTASLVQALLRHFELDLVVGFEWADTCSRLRLDGFGGGTVAVSRRSAVWFSTGALLEKAVKAETERLKLKSGKALQDVDLDGAVVAIASALAADVNSRDAEAQLDFLHEHGWKPPAHLLREAKS